MTDSGPCEERGRLEIGDGASLAYARVAAADDDRRPGVLWLGGYRSDMDGTKATRLAEWAAATGRAFARFDYRGHGRSDGAFEDFVVSDWLADAKRALDALTRGPQILVGSSMGGWIAARLALAEPARVAGVVVIAPALDFTEKLVEPALDDAARASLETAGRLEVPSDYGAPTVYTRALIEDGRRLGLLGRPIPIAAPVRIIQGMADAEVPWRHAMALAEALASDDVEIALTKNGDHRLSTAADLERLVATIEALA
ncbi:MAG: alpha/beta hydrolase [Parvularculaceae bacterium]